MSRYLLLKLAQRCNIACTYCYWFRDRSVYDKPALLEPEAEAALLTRLREHVRTYELDRFAILLHGGEPTLLGPGRFEALAASLRSLEEAEGFSLKLDITTNGTLVDEEWARLFRDYRVGVTLSIDGPEAVHDRRRLDFKGSGTYARVIRALDILRAAGVEPGVLAVCEPASDPAELFDLFVDELEVGFDVLVPDANHEDAPAPIAPFYVRLFDLWYDRYQDQRVRVRFLDSVIKGLLGYPSGSESIGYGAVTTTTMLTDGSLEPLDVLRTARFNITRTGLNIRTHSLQDIQTDPRWQEILHASLNLAAPCEECRYKQACGGGHIASRWSSARRYDNPSVYCEDFKTLLGHCWDQISADLFVQTEHERIPLHDA